MQDIEYSNDKPLQSPENSDGIMRDIDPAPFPALPLNTVSYLVTTKSPKEKGDSQSPLSNVPTSTPPIMSIVSSTAPSRSAIASSSNTNSAIAMPSNCPLPDDPDNRIIASKIDKVHPEEEYQVEEVEEELLSDRGEAGEDKGIEFSK